jgi:hypothetical protein
LPPTTLRVEAPLDRLRYLRELQRRAASAKSASGAIRYYDDPVGFARDCIDWRGTDGLAEYQEEIMGALPRRKRIAVRGPHGLTRSREVHHCGGHCPVVRPYP